MAFFYIFLGAVFGPRTPHPHAAWNAPRLTFALIGHSGVQTPPNCKLSPQNRGSTEKGSPHEVQKHAHVRYRHMRGVSAGCRARGFRDPNRGHSLSPTGSRPGWYPGLAPFPTPEHAAAQDINRVASSKTTVGGRSPLRPAWNIWPWRSGEREEGVLCVGSCLL